MKPHALNQWSEPPTIPLYWSRLASLRQRLFLSCAFVCHYFWHFSSIVLICQRHVAPSFRTPLRFQRLCHSKLCYLSSLSSPDSRPNKSTVTTFMACQQIGLFTVVIFTAALKRNETLGETSDTPVLLQIGYFSLLCLLNSTMFVEPLLLKQQQPPL